MNSQTFTSWFLAKRAAVRPHSKRDNIFLVKIRIARGISPLNRRLTSQARWKRYFGRCARPGEKQPRSQGSFLPVPTERERKGRLRENPGNEVGGRVKKRLLPVHCSGFSHVYCMNVALQLVNWWSALFWRDSGMFVWNKMAVTQIAFFWRCC